LYVSQNQIHTSAGIASGIDLMLHLLEQLTDGYFAWRVARELVVYNRRNGAEEQVNPYFQYRNHIHSGIHKVQDFIISNLASAFTLTDLAEIAHMSERNFTRVFKKEIGLTVNQFIHAIRLEKLKTLMLNPATNKAQMAAAVGLGSERQVGRLLKGLG